MKEIWKEVPIYPGLLYASNIGRVKTLRNGKHTILKNSLQKSGYYYVTFSFKGNKKTVMVHRMICYAFFGISKLDVNHKDLDKLNNNLENLEFCSTRENVYHAINITKSNGLPVGVRKNYYKYVAYIKINHVQVCLGSFNTPDEASKVYLAKYKQLNAMSNE